MERRENFANIAKNFFKRADEFIERKVFCLDLKDIEKRLSTC